MTNVPVKSLKFAQFDLNYKGSVVSIVLFCFCRKNDKNWSNAICSWHMFYKENNSINS